MLGIQYRFDLLGGEAPIFQIASTLDGDRQRLVGVITKFLAIGAYGQVKPIALGLAQRALDILRARATLLEFEGNALRPVTAFRACTQIGLRVARVALQMLLGKVIEDARDVSDRVAAGFQLTLQLDPGMLAARERRERLRPKA